MAENELSRVKIVYLCYRLGPYHYAQLNAAHKHAEIVALEYSRIDQAYEWDVVDEASDFHRVTLFKDKPIYQQAVRTIIERVRNVLDEVRPDVVAIMGWDRPAALIALWWCLDSGTPSIMMSDSQRHDKPRVWWKEVIKGRLVRLASSGFVGGTPHITYLKSLGVAEQDIVTGCDVVDNEYFATETRIVRNNDAVLRKTYSLPEHFFLVSCRFLPRKNLANVLRAYAQHLHVTREPPWKLVLLGDGELKPQLIRLRDDLGLGEMVLLPGFIQYHELPVYYGLAEALILASTSETWGLVVSEAMASGLPVIVSSRCGCALDLVKHGENGFIFDPGDIEALAEHLRFVSSNECPRELMGNASRRIIEDWDLQLFARNLCKAAELAKMAPRRVVGNCDKALLWTLIHLLRS